MVKEAGHVVPWELARLEKRGELRPDETVRETVEAWTADAIRRQQELVSKASA